MSKSHSMKNKLSELAVRLEWSLLQLQSIITKIKRKQSRNIAVIVPADPLTLIGSKGDEAMLRAIIEHVKNVYLVESVYIHCSKDVPDALFSRFGVLKHPNWKRGAGLLHSIESLEELNPRHTVVMGADMMDGHYSTQHTLRCLGIMRFLPLRTESKVRITGFSFNAEPKPILRRYFNGFGSEQAFHLRDPISFERFRAFSTATAYLTADVAFLMKPDSGPEANSVEQWITCCEEKGMKVVGLNAHPMLFLSSGPRTLEIFVQTLCNALVESVDRDEVAFLCIPHDNRGNVGDEGTLAAIASSLRDSGYLVSTSPVSVSAATVKRFVKSLDGVITGRMHLGIAALSNAIPILALSYQGKFAGLFRHFGFDDRQEIRPEELLRKEVLKAKICAFVETLDEQKRSIEGSAANVKKLAELNFE